MTGDDVRVAIVTGGGQQATRQPGLVGVGAAICERLATRGMRVAVVDLDEEAARRTASRLADQGFETLICPADVSSPTEVSACVERIVSNWGRIDALVNSAATLGRTSEEDLEAEHWDNVFRVNVRGCVTMCKAAVTSMPAGGAVVNVSSIAGFRPSTGSLSYAVSKGALLPLTKALAVHLGSRGIRVNAVCPGSIWTPMALRAFDTDDEHAVQKLRADREQLNLLGIEGTAWDIAEGVAFLVGPESRWITGQTLTIDGGATLEPTRSLAALGRSPLL